MEWISVKDKLPKIDKKQLPPCSEDVIAFDGKYVRVGALFKSCGNLTWCYLDDNDHSYSFDDVTHWMPLPEPPEAK